MKAVEVRQGKHDIHLVREEVPLGFGRPIEILHSSHVIAESATRRVLRHEGATCFLFLVHGALDLRHGGRHLTLSPDEALLFPSTGPEWPALSCGSGAEFYLLQFRRSLPAAGIPRQRLDVPEHVAFRSSGRMKHLVRMFMEEARCRGGSPLVLHHLLVLMLCEMARAASVQGGAPDHENALESMASRVDAYIAAHYHEPIGTPDIAVELRYNPDYLERAYRAERRMSIRDAIHARRIREARAQLLLQRALGVAEVAALCGYSDPGYFRRVFKRATSMTPHGYRERNGAPPPPSGRVAARR